MESKYKQRAHAALKKQAITISSIILYKHRLCELPIQPNTSIEKILTEIFRFNKDNQSRDIFAAIIVQQHQSN